MKRRFVVTPEAKANLRDILFDIAEDSPDTAERLRPEIYEAFQRLGRRDLAVFFSYRLRSE